MNTNDIDINTIEEELGETVSFESIDEHPEDEETETVTEQKLPQESKKTTVSEDERRKAHEKSEAKRKAEWEAAKKAREDSENAEWDKALALSDTALIAASVKRAEEDAERVTRHNMKECVTEYIQTSCYDDIELAAQVMHPRKSMIRCFKYINRKAREYVEQEMKDMGIEPSRDGYGCDVPDDLCYQWAKDYFYDMDAPEDKKDDEKDFVPRPFVPSAPISRKSEKPKTTKKKEKTTREKQENPVSIETTPPEDSEDEQLSFAEAEEE